MAGRQDYRICNEMGIDHESSCEWFYDSRYEMMGSRVVFTVKRFG